jgi:GNAT superfamily N-acetyltransferase
VAGISDSDIGKRVTIRLVDTAGYRDIVGHLISATSLKNRHGQTVHFDPKKIHLWREIIDIPRTATSGAPFSIRVKELELIFNQTWVAQEEFHVGNWIFRADVGITRRANSALILGSDNHIDEVIHWYQVRKLQPTVFLVPELNEELDAELERRGFQKLLDLEVMVKNPVERIADKDFVFFDNPSRDWLAVHNDEKIEPLLIRTKAKYLELRSEGKLIAIGRIAFSNDWAIISRIWVAAELRSKGIGRKVLHALESQANGAKLALQVQQENESAYQLYLSEGYSTHHVGRFRSQFQQIDLSQDCQC